MTALLDEFILARSNPSNHDQVNVFVRQSPQPRLLPDRDSPRVGRMEAAMCSGWQVTLRELILERR